MGEEAGWGRGWGGQSRSGRWGWGLKDVGWPFPALCAAGWGPQPPPSRQCPPQAGSRHTDPEADRRRTVDPLRLCSQTWGWVVPLGGGSKKTSAWVWWEGASCFPPDPGGRGQSGGLAGRLAQRSSRVGGTEAAAGEAVCLFCQGHTLRPQWEVSEWRVGGAPPSSKRERWLVVGISKGQWEPRVGWAVGNRTWRFQSLSPFPPS